MKILFVCSGNDINGISNPVRNQGESIKDIGYHLDYFSIIGKGAYGYFRSIPKIRKAINKGHYDIIHAHYAFSAFAATLAGSRPLFVSLMGSDLKSGPVIRLLIKLFHKVWWHTTIVKSTDMNRNLNLKNIRIIPNGVNTELFRPLNQLECLKKLGWEDDKIHILFPSNPLRPEKNFALAKNAYNLVVKKLNIQLHYIYNVSNDQVPYYYNAAALVLMTSHWEGSPNVIKEAMACNCPIVSTEVGDVEMIFGSTPGCYISSFESDDVAKKINMALDYGKRTLGRKRIIDLGLSSTRIANVLIDSYKKAIQ